MQILQRAPLFGEQSGLLLFPQSLRRDLRQFVCAGFTDEHGDFVIGWLAAIFRCKSFDGGVPLCASYAVTAVRFKLAVSPSSSKPSMVYSDFRVSTI